MLIGQSSSMLLLPLVSVSKPSSGEKDEGEEQLVQGIHQKMHTRIPSSWIHTGYVTLDKRSRGLVVGFSRLSFFTRWCFQHFCTSFQCFDFNINLNLKFYFFPNVAKFQTLPKRRIFTFYLSLNIFKFLSGIVNISNVIVMMKIEVAYVS